MAELANAGLEIPIAGTQAPEISRGEKATNALNHFLNTRSDQVANGLKWFISADIGAIVGGVAHSAASSDHFGGMIGLPGVDLLLGAGAGLGIRAAIAGAERVPAVVRGGIKAGGEFVDLGKTLVGIGDMARKKAVGIIDDWYIKRKGMVITHESHASPELATFNQTLRDRMSAEKRSINHGGTMAPHLRGQE